MTIKIHLVFSFLIHSLLLTYFLSLPIYKSSDALSFEGFFVYLGSEEGRVSGEPSSKGEGESSSGKKQVVNKIDSEIALIASQVRKEAGRKAFKDEGIKKPEPSGEEENYSSPEEDISQREQVVEIIKHGIVEKKVFAAQAAPQEKPNFVEQGKGIDTPRKEQQAEIDVPDGSYAQKAPEDTAGSLKEGVTVYEGTVLKTMPGFTIIPYEETTGVEILHARREETKETKETKKTKGEHKVEVLEKQEESSKEEVEKEKFQEHVEVVEVRKDEKIRKEFEAIKKEIYRGGGPLSEETTVKILSHDKKQEEGLEIQGEIEPEGEVFKGKEAEVTRPGDEHNTIKTVRTGTPPKIETGLLVESLQGRMVMPLENSLSGEPLPIEKQVEEKAERQAEVKEQIEIQKQAKVEVEAEKQIETKEKAEVEEQEEAKAREQAKAEAEAEEQIETAKQTEKEIEIEKEIKKDNETETEIEKQIKESDETDVPKVIYFHEETKRTTLTKTDKGLLLKTIPGAMKMPFQIDLPEETVQGEFVEQMGEKELESQKEEKEPVQEFVEVEKPFDRLRVEEKLKYLETSEKEKMMKIKEKDIVTREPDSEIIAEKTSVKNEEQEETETPVLEIVKSSREQVPPETVHDEKGKDTDSKEEETENQLPEERSDKQLIAPDITEIDTGLLLTSVPGQTTVPFKEDLIVDLPKEKAGGGDEIKKGGDTEDKSPLETTGYEAKKVEIKNYLDLPQKEEDRKRELKKGTGDEKKGVKMEEATAEYYKKEDVLQKTSPFFEKLQEIEKKEGGVEESAEVIPPKEIDSFGEKEGLMTAEIRPGPESREGVGDGVKEPSFGISIPDVFFKKDIKIEISMNDPETTEVSFQLMNKAHPLDEKGGSLSQKEIKLVEDTSMDYIEYKRVFSTEKAEKGIYIFVMKNNGPKRYEAELLFHIFEGKSGERKKEYKTIELPPNTTLKYKFIIPEAVFWDDEGYFTGTIESSKTLTKFNEKTGLIWQEEKDN